MTTKPKDYGSFSYAPPKPKDFSSFTYDVPKKPAPPKLDDSNSYVNDEGLRVKNSMDMNERRAAQALTALDFPMFGFNDEIVGTGTALGEQAQQLLGLMPKGYRAHTMKEGRDQAAQTKERYTAARNSGEVGNWEAGNVASNIGNIAGSAWGFGKLADLMQGGVEAGTAAFAKSRLGDGAAKAVTNSDKLAEWLAAQMGAGAIFGEGQALGDAKGDIGDAEGRNQRLAAVAAMGAIPLAVGAGANIAGGALGHGLGGAANTVAEYGGPAAKSAYKYLAEVLTDAGLTVDQARNSLKEMQALNPETRLAHIDAGDPHFTGFGDVAATTGQDMGESAAHAGHALKPIQEGAYGRTVENLNQKFGGTKEGSINTDTEALLAQAEKDATPLYDKFRGEGPKTSPLLEQILNGPTFAKTVREAASIAEETGDIAAGSGFTLAPNGKMTNFSPDVVNKVKTTLDDQIEALLTRGQNTAARDMTILKNKLVGEADKLWKTYAPAREAFQGPASLNSALREGSKAVGTNGADIAARLAKMSGSEKQFFLKGMARKIIEQGSKTSDEGSMRNLVMGTDAKRQALKAVLSPEDFAKLTKEMDIEKRMHDVYASTYKNSQTARLQNRKMDIEGSTAEDAAMLGHTAEAVISPVHQALAHGWGWITSGLRGFAKEKRGELAKALFSKDPAEQEMAFKAIQAHMEMAKVAKERARRGLMGNQYVQAPVGGLSAAGGTEITMGAQDFDNYVDPTTGQLIPNPLAGK